MQLLQLIDISPFFTLEYWKEVGQNAIGCTIGSIIAIAISVIIYVNSIEKTEKEKRLAKKEEETNNLKAFYLLLSKGIKTSKEQSENVKKLIEKLSEPFIEYPLLSFVSLNDLKRIINNITIEKTGIAYMNAFSSLPNPAKEFTEILSCIDYLYLQFGQLPEMMKLAIQYDYDRKKELEKLFQFSSRELIQFMLGVTDPSILPHLDEMNTIMENFSKGKIPNYDVKYYYDSYFVPMHEYCGKLLLAGHRFSFLIPVVQQTQDGRQKYNSMIEENKRMLEDMQEIYASIHTGIDSLILNCKTLFSSDYAS